MKIGLSQAIFIALKKSPDASYISSKSHHSLTLVSFNKKGFFWFINRKWNDDISLLIFDKKFEWSQWVRNFTRQFRANIFEECIKFICNLLSINNHTPFFWEIFHSPLFLDNFFISCVIQGLYYTFGFNFTSFFGKQSSQSNQIIF